MDKPGKSDNNSGSRWGENQKVGALVLYSKIKKSTVKTALYFSYIIYGTSVANSESKNTVQFPKLV